MTTPTPPRRGVLIIAPEPNMAALVSTMLYAIGKRDIRETTDAAQARIDLASRPFEVIVIDDALSQPDAVEMVRALRAGIDGPNRETPVIMMASAPDASRIKAARDAGVTEFLRKPFAATHLKARLDSIAERPRNFIEATAYSGPDRRRKRIAVDADRRGSD